MNAAEAAGAGGSKIAAPIEGKKKKKGILGRVGGAVLSGLSAPQQVALGAVKGVNKAVQGDLGGALGALGQAGKEALTIGQADGDIDLANALAHRDKKAEGGYRDRKLAWGLNTVGSALIDPAMYVGIGEGAAAARGISALAKAKGVTDDVVRAGIKSGEIKLAKGAADRSLMEASLVMGGSKVKKAERIAKAANKRAGGGVIAHIPGTEISATIKGTDKLHPILGTKARIAKTPLGGKIVDAGRKAFNPIGALADELGDTGLARKLRDMGSERSNARWIANDDTFHELKNALKGREITAAEDSLLMDALEKGDEFRAAFKDAHPELGEISDIMHRMRTKLTDAQVEAGVLGKITSADEVVKARELADNLTGEAKALDDRAKGLAARAAKDARTAKTKLVKAVRAHSEGKITLEELNKQKSRVTAIEKAAKKIEAKSRKTHNEWMTKAKEAKKATKTADNTVEGVSGIHDTSTYMQRKPTAKAAEVLEDAGMGKVFEGDSLRSSLKQSATEFRGVLPELPAAGFNDLHAAYHAAGKGDAGYDAILNALRHKDYAPYVKGRNLEAEAQRLAQISEKVPAEAEIFQTSAISSMLSRAESGNRAIAATKYVNDIKAMNAEAKNALGVLHDEASMLDANITPKQLKDAGWEQFELPELGTHWAPKEVVREMKNVVQVIGRDDWLDTFNNAMKGWQQFWKSQATTGLLGSLPFAMRNARSNVYLMITEGMGPKEVVSYMKRAKDMEKTARDVYDGKFADLVNKDGLESVLQSKLGDKYNEFNQMRKDGIISSGFFKTDFKDVTGSKLKGLGVEAAEKAPQVGRVRRGTKFVLGQEGAVSQAGYRLNSGIERNARMALYMHNLDKYGDPVIAAQRTKRVLFDYDELSAFEKKVMKNIIPFYTFMRKNLPLQLETLAQNPMRIIAPERISQTASPGIDEDAPEWMKGQGSRGINSLIPAVGGMISTPDRPIYAAGETLSPILHSLKGQGREAIGSIANLPSGPLVNALKAGYEIKSGTDLYTGGRVKPGAVSDIQRLVGSQLPSLARLPGRVGPVTTEDLTGKSKKDKKTMLELLKFVTGIRVDQPR